MKLWVVFDTMFFTFFSTKLFNWQWVTYSVVNGTF